MFHRDGTELMKDTSDSHPIIGVGAASILGGHQQTVSSLTVLTQFRRVVMAITQVRREGKRSCRVNKSPCLRSAGLPRSAVHGRCVHDEQS